MSGTEQTEQAPEATPSIQDEARAALAARPEKGSLTAYSVAQALNAVLARHGLPPVREQMLYQYNSKGLITKTPVDGNRISRPDAAAFITKFVTKRTDKQS